MYCRVILTVLLFAVVPFSPHSHLKKTGLLVRKFEKVRFLLNGPGLKFFHPMDAMRYLLSYFLLLNTLKGTVKAPALDLRLNNVRCIIKPHLEPLKGVTSGPFFYGRFPQDLHGN